MAEELICTSVQCSPENIFIMWLHVPETKFNGSSLMLLNDGVLLCRLPHRHGYPIVVSHYAVSYGGRFP